MKKKRKIKRVGLIKTIIVSLVSAVSVSAVSIAYVEFGSVPNAYQAFVDSGYNGNVLEWLGSLAAEETGEGKSAYEIAVENGYEGSEDDWLKALVGKAGKDGANGKSAYELACENGFEGTLVQWLDSLVGENGFDGASGLSAYELACVNGYEGTVTEWLVSLVGADGTDGKDGADGQDGQDGANGKSAYELAVENGYEGDVQTWIASLVGANGADGTDDAEGKSAYQLAVDNGYDGTLQQWLQSLAGKDGIGIRSIEKTSTADNVDTYTITYTDGTKGTFTVTNGKDGVDGIQGVQGEKGDKGDKGEDGHTPIITIQNGSWYIDGQDTGVSAVGANGVAGATGNGISAIQKTDTADKVDTYTITYTDGTWTTFTVTNGKDGIDGVQGVDGREVLLGLSETHIQWKYNENDEWKDLISIQEIRGSKWFVGEGVPVAVADSKIGDLYLNTLNSNVYELTESGWTLTANIKGIGVQNITIAYLYDEQNNYVCRYTITYTDGSKHIIDVSEPRRVLEIKEETFCVPASNAPTEPPSLKFAVVWSDGTNERIQLENYMVVNLHEISFSVSGTYRVFISYRGAYGYITMSVYGQELMATEESYLSHDAFVNFGSSFDVDKIYFNTYFTNPYIAMRTLSLADENVKLLSVKFADGTSPAGTYSIYDGRLSRSSNSYSDPSAVLIGKTFALEVECYGVKRTLQCKWLASEQDFLNAKVKKLEYRGGPIFWQNGIEFADVDYSAYGYLDFYLEFIDFKGYYIREIDAVNDKFIGLDTQAPILLERGDGNIDVFCDIQATIYPGVTTRLYTTDNIVSIVVLEGNVTLQSASFSQESVIATRGIPDMSVTFNIDVAPYQLTVPLTEDMLYYNGSDYGFSQDTSTGTRSISVRYNYYGQILQASIPIGIIDLGKYNNTTGLNYGDKYHVITLAQELIRTTKSPQMVPTIEASIDYYFKYQLAGVNGAKTEELLYSETLTITADMITNLALLDFSKPGLKTIEFYHYGYKTVTIELYSIDECVIESVSPISTSMTIDKGEDLLAVLKEKYIGQTMTVTYFENYDQETSFTFVFTEELVEECFDLSTFNCNYVGAQKITFRYTTADKGTYEQAIAVTVEMIDDGVVYTVEDGVIGGVTTESVTVYLDDNYVDLGTGNPLYFYHVKDVAEGEVVQVIHGNGETPNLSLGDGSAMLLPVSFEDSLRDMDVYYLFDHENKTVKGYYMFSENEQRYKLDATILEADEDTSQSYVIVDGDVVALHLIAEDAEGNVSEQVIYINAEWNQAQTALVPTNYMQIGVLVYLALQEDGETLKMMHGKPDGVSYLLETNGINIGLGEGDVYIALCPDGTCYPELGDIISLEMLTYYQYYGEKDGLPIVVLYAQNGQVQPFYATLDAENKIATLHQDVYQIDFSAYKALLETENSDYTYDITGSVSLLPTGDGYISITVKRTYTDGSEYVDSATNVALTYYYLDENAIKYDIDDYYSALNRLRDGGWHFVHTENANELKLTQQTLTYTYLVDYAGFKGIPTGIQVVKAELVLDANDSDATLVVYLSETQTIDITFRYREIPELGLIVATDADTTYIFAMSEGGVDGYAGGAKLLNGVPGEQYKLDASAIENILKQEEDVRFLESYLFMNEEKSYASIFIRMKAYYSDGSYEEVPLIMLFRYTQEDDLIVPLGDAFGDMPITFSPSQDNAEEYVASFGANYGIKGIYYSDKYGTVVLYNNGYCDLETPIVSLGSSNDGQLPHYYKMIGDDGILIMSILIGGATFKIVDDYLLVQDYTYLTAQDNLQTVSVQMGEYDITLYIDSATGEGYALYAAANQEGSGYVTTATKIGDGLYRMVFLLTIELIIEIHEDGAVTANVATYLEM